MEENRDYHAYRYGDYLTPGSELKIEHSVVCENVDISTLITMGTDSLEAMRQGSIDGEQFKYPEKFARIAGEIIAVKQPATNEHREKPMMHHSGPDL